MRENGRNWKCDLILYPFVPVAFGLMIVQDVAERMWDMYWAFWRDFNGL